MSASSNVIWRGLRRVLRALHIVRPAPLVEVSPAALAVAAPVHVTIELTPAVIAVAKEEEAAVAPAPVEIVAEIVRRPAMPSLISRQLAYTASRNVPKGRKATPAIVSGQRHAPALKAKPVVLKTVKKAPKRRHVWLCNQSRVVRPVVANIVPLNAARTRQTIKPAAQKPVRTLRLAA